MAHTKQDTNPLHSPAVEGPNSIPTGSRFDTFTGNYAAGFPDIPFPQWLLDDAERLRQERLGTAGSKVVEIVGQSDDE